MRIVVRLIVANYEARSSGKLAPSILLWQKQHAINMWLITDASLPTQSHSPPDSPKAADEGKDPETFV